MQEVIKVKETLVPAAIASVRVLNMHQCRPALRYRVLMKTNGSNYMKIFIMSFLCFVCPVFGQNLRCRTNFITLFVSNLEQNRFWFISTNYKTMNHKELSP